MAGGAATWSGRGAARFRVGGLRGLGFGGLALVGPLEDRPAASSLSPADLAGSEPPAPSATAATGLSRLSVSTLDGGLSAFEPALRAAQSSLSRASLALCFSDRGRLAGGLSSDIPRTISIYIRGPAGLNRDYISFEPLLSPFKPFCSMQDSRPFALRILSRIGGNSLPAGGSLRYLTTSMAVSLLFLATLKRLHQRHRTPRISPLL